MIARSRASLSRSARSASRCSVMSRPTPWTSIRRPASSKIPCWRHCSTRAPAVGQRHLALVRVVGPPRCQRGPFRLDGRPRLGGEHGEVVPARVEELLPRHAHVAAVGVVDEGSAPVRANARDQVVLRLDDATVARLARLERRPRVVLLGRVPPDALVLDDAPRLVEDRDVGPELPTDDAVPGPDRILGRRLRPLGRQRGPVALEQVARRLDALEVLVDWGMSSSGVMPLKRQKASFTKVLRPSGACRTIHSVCASTIAS